MGWLLQRDEPEERMNRSKPRIPRTGTVMALFLEVLEELDDEGDVEIGEG
jgi:hypothetical protein